MFIVDRSMPHVSTLKVSSSSLLFEKKSLKYCVRYRDPINVYTVHCTDLYFYICYQPRCIVCSCMYIEVLQI